MDAACEILWFNGIVVVVSAGNNGSANLFPPANDPFVITVGATEDKGTASIADDSIATFSAYGFTENLINEPELVAPGKNIVSLSSGRASILGKSYPDNKVGTSYFRMSGTSMSAPMVSGAVALLLQDEPNLTPDQVKYRLMATANKTWPGYNATKAGAGYLDIYAAVHGTTTQSANTGLPASQLLTTGSNPITWGSVSWNSVSWNGETGWRCNHASPGDHQRGRRKIDPSPGRLAAKPCRCQGAPRPVGDQQHGGEFHLSGYFLNPFVQQQLWNE